MLWSRLWSRRFFSCWLYAMEEGGIGCVTVAPQRATERRANEWAGGCKSHNRCERSSRAGAYMRRGGQ